MLNSLITHRGKILTSLLLFLSLVCLGIFLNDQNETFSWGSYFSIVCLYVVIFILGVFSNLFASKQAAEDALLANRSIPLFIAVFTMSATWIGGGYINGSAEYANTSGLAWVQAPWGYTLSLIIGALFFVKPMRAKNYTTMLDPIEERFGKSMTSLLFLPALIGEIFWSAAILTALGTTFSVIIGIDPIYSILLSAGISITYTALGGLWAVAFTDVFQILLVIVGLILPIPFILEEVGPWAGIWERYQNSMGSLARLFPPLDFQTDPNWGNAFWFWLDSAFLLVFGGLAWQVYFQRVLAVKTNRAAKNLSYSAALVCILVAVPAIMVGIIAQVTDWQQLVPGLNADIGSMTLPYTIKYLAPPGVAIISLVAISAAVMSSIDSSILSASTMTAWNIYRPMINPQMSAKQLKKVMKISIIGVGTLTTILALKVQSIYVLWFLSSDLVYCILFPQLVAALFFKRANRIGSICGFAVSLFFRLGGGEPALGLPSFIAYPMYSEEAQMSYFPFKTLTMLAAMLTICLVSLLTRKVHFPRANRESSL